MRRHRHLAGLVVALILALAAFTGSALAGGGQGNGGGNGNGHDQQAAPTPAAPAPAVPAPAATKPAKTSHGSSTKQSDTSASNPATGGSNAHGVKPSNTTKHDTYAKASSDKTKQYGNGKTAGQIATQAGYPDATLHGPGNSQPHKAAPCPGGHEVDVHALKHKGSKCGTSAPAPATHESKPETKHESTPAVPAPATATASDCATTTHTVTEQVLTGVKHFIGPKGSGRFVIIHPSTNSAHYTGHHADDIPIYATVQKTVVVKNDNCPNETVVTTQTVTTAAPAVAAAAPTPATAVAPAAQVAAAQQTQAPAAAAPVAAGAVKGATVVLKPKAKSKPAGGVLGATTRLGGTVASSNLPFTGLPLWIFVAVAAALILIGAGVRRSASDRL